MCSIYLAQLSAEGYSIFVVRGEYPVFNQDLDGAGKWYDVVAIEAASKNPQPVKRSRRTFEDDQIAEAIRASLLASPTTSPVPPQTGLQQSASQPQTCTSQPTILPEPSFVIEEETSDAELKQALALSLERDAEIDGLRSFENKNDVSAARDSEIEVQLNLPTGRKERKCFSRDSTIGDIYLFGNSLMPSKEYVLRGTFPVTHVFEDLNLSLRQAVELTGGGNQLNLFVQPKVYKIDD